MPLFFSQEEILGQNHKPELDNSVQLLEKSTKSILRNDSKNVCAGYRLVLDHREPFPEIFKAPWETRGL